VSLQPGDRVRVLEPYFNHAIWGATGTIDHQWGLSSAFVVALDRHTHTHADAMLAENEYLISGDDLILDRPPVQTLERSW